MPIAAIPTSFIHNYIYIFTTGSRIFNLIHFCIDTLLRRYTFTLITLYGTGYNFYIMRLFLHRNTFYTRHTFTCHTFTSLPTTITRWSCSPLPRSPRSSCCPAPGTRSQMGRFVVGHTLRRQCVYSLRPIRSSGRV